MIVFLYKPRNHIYCTGNNSLFENQYSIDDLKGNAHNVQNFFSDTIMQINEMMD